MVGFLVSFVGLGARYVFGVFFKPIETEFSMTRGATSGIFSIYMLLCCLTAIFGGWAMERYGPKKVALFMAGFIALSFLLTSQAYAPWHLFLTYSLLLSLGTGPTYGVVNTTASRWFVKKRGLVVGITSSGGGVGAIVLAPFATYLISSFNWRSAFVVLGLVTGIGLMVVSLMLIKDPRDVGLYPDGDKGEPSRGNIDQKQRPFPISGFSLDQSLRMGQLWFLISAWVSLSLSLHMIFVHIVPYALDIGFSPMDGAYIVSLIGLANIPGRIIIGRLSDILGRKALGITCALIHSGTLFWLMWSDQLWMLYVFAVVFGFLWGGSGTVTTALIGDIFGTHSLGAIMGIMSGGWALGAAIGPAIGGYIFDVTGHYFAAFGAGTASLFATAVFLSLIKVVSGERP